MNLNATGIQITCPQTSLVPAATTTMVFKTTLAAKTGSANGRKRKKSMVRVRQVHDTAVIALAVRDVREDDSSGDGISRIGHAQTMHQSSSAQEEAVFARGLRSAHNQATAIDLVALTNQRPRRRMLGTATAAVIWMVVMAAAEATTVEAVTVAAGTPLSAAMDLGEEPQAVEVVAAAMPFRAQGCDKAATAATSATDGTAAGLKVTMKLMTRQEIPTTKRLAEGAEVG